MEIKPTGAALGADIVDFGGRLDQIVGDEIVALFGAPVAHELGVWWGFLVVRGFTFAIAVVAHHHGIPWMSFKYITDDANASSGEDWHARVNQGELLFLEKLREIAGD